MNLDAIAEKEKYRRVGWLERIGESAGKLLGPGWLRARSRAFYHYLLMLSSGHRGIPCALPGGETVRVLPGYRFAAWSTVEYEAFKTAVRPGSVALDIGANIGAYSLLLGQWVGPAGKVFAFEPAPETFAALRRHIEMNGLEKVVVPLPNAISDRVATLDFFANNFQGTNRLLSEKEASAKPSRIAQVQAMTIDKFCAKRGLQPDFIKIDIEGFELAALRGARETLRARRGRLALFVEMHPTTWKLVGLSLEDMITELDFQGLVAKPLVSEGDPWKIEGVCMRLVVK